MSKREDVDLKINMLRQIRTTLTKLIDACPGKGALEFCSILGAMEPPEHTDSKLEGTKWKAKERHIMRTVRKFLLHLTVLAILFAGNIQAWAASVHSFKVDGLACPFCSYGVEKQLKAIPGVSGIKISIKTSTVTVTMKDGMKLTKTQADRAVKAAGFTMRNFR